MKKTLFLSAILGAALCSSAFGESITVGGTQYDDVTIVTTAALDAVPTSNYILIGGTTSTDNSQKNYKIQPGGNMGAWAPQLTASQTIIVAPASSETTEYAGYQLFFDAGGYEAQTINANIIAGGNDDVNLLRIWGGNSFTFNGNLTLVGNGVNLWNQQNTHYFKGGVIASAGQTLKQTGGGTLNLAQANLSQFDGTIKVEGGNVKLGSGLANMELANGTTANFSAGKVTTGSHLVLTQGNVFYGDMGILADGAERITAAKGGNRLTLQAGSEKTFASMSTTGSNGEWLVVEGVGNTEEGLFTDIILNSTNNGLIIGVSGTTSHIGALSGTAGSAQIRGDWNGAGTDRVLAVHQNTNTTFAGQFIASTGSMAGRDVALEKYGTGTLTLTGANGTSKLLALHEGGITFSGNGSWAGNINVNGGVLTFASALADSASIGAVTVGADGSIKFNASQYAANKAKFSSLSQGGTLILTGATGANGIDLSTAWSGSTITLNAVSGKLLGSAIGDTTITQNIHLINTTSAAAEWSTVEGGSYVFNGAITDDASMHGNMVFGAAGTETSVKFNGSLAGWHSTLNNYSGFRVSNGTVNLTIAGELTGDDAVVSNTITVDSISKPDNDNRSGKLNVTVARDATFNGHFYANTLTVNAGLTVKITDTTNNVGIADSITIGNGASLTISGAAAKSTDALTLGSGSELTLGNHNVNLTTSTLTVTGASTLNANLVVSANGTMDFSNAIATGTTLTMGCSVEIGNNVTVVIDESIIDGIANRGETVAIITDAEAITALDDLHFNFVSLNSDGTYKDLSYANLRLEVGMDGKSIVVAPEPATATLSLLALAALCARRKRH